MTREEFVKWLETTIFCREVPDQDTTWRYLVDYADYVWDEIWIWEDKVNFSWEERYWGGTNYRNKEYTFEAFKEAYEKDELKNQYD